MKLHEFFHDGGPYSSPNQWTGCQMYQLVINLLNKNSTVR